MSSNSKKTTITHNGTIDGLVKVSIVDLDTAKQEENIFIQTNLTAGTDDYTVSIKYKMIGTSYFKDFENNTISNSQTIGLHVELPAEQLEITSTFTNTDSILDIDVFAKALA